MELKIPREDFESLIELINLSNTEFDSIISEIENIPFDIDFKILEERLKEITSYYKVILGLYFTFCKFDIPENKFAKKLTKYYKSKINDETLDKETEDRIIKLFKKKNPIRIAIKSKILNREVSKLFYESRILTDIRPVFSSNEEDYLVGQVIINNLKILYKKGETYKEFFVTLEEEDLYDLKNVLDRAINKTKILKSKKNEYGK